VKNLFPHIYPASERRDPQIQYHYDSEGVIGRVFTYNAELDRMVLADLESFKKAFGHTFGKAEDEIGLIVADSFFIHKLRHG
jgi:hypothetical protein